MTAWLKVQMTFELLRIVVLRWKDFEITPGVALKEISTSLYQKSQNLC